MKRPYFREVISKIDVFCPTAIMTPSWRTFFPQKTIYKVIQIRIVEKIQLILLIIIDLSFFSWNFSKKLQLFLLKKLLYIPLYFQIVLVVVFVKSL